ncbi:protein kinase [Dyella sp. C11]|uniref:protein kinase domain-containing protein n=1 Tax=Dyella sp. C11 TaxID=2126991 RepID=UPI000D644995|nr:protein kinase [Dyella sp. C11]
MDTAELPRHIGRYRIDGILGEGAMAVVYAGFDPGIDRPVAIKCLHRDAASAAGSDRRLLLEARASGQLVHPNIVTIFDSGETDDGRPYIAMERLPGDTLASMVAREGLPPLPMAIELVSQMAAALDHAHGQGIIHQDVKPENIMLADGWHYAKLSDFGIAERRARQKTRTGNLPVGGTPAYMAPERLRGEPADERSDLFSLGVVLYWLITGKLPWPEMPDMKQLIRERQRHPHPEVTPLDPAAPALLTDVVSTLLAPTVEARYQSGAEVINDLRLARREYERTHETPIATRIISLRLRWIGTLGAILCLVLLLGLAGIYAKQNIAVNGLATDFGSSLGRIVAGESAENLLLGDEAATRALVQDVSRNQQIHYLAIANREGKVVASTQSSDLGRPLDDAGESQPLASFPDVKRYVGHPAGLDNMMVFDVPIRYQEKTVGELRLGVSNAPLVAAQRTTLGVIIAVLLVTLLALITAAYWLFRQPLALMAMLNDALMRVARGEYRHRIRLARRDELGQLFASFNLMTHALESRHPGDAKPAPGPAAQSAQQPTLVVSPPSE